MGPVGPPWQKKAIMENPLTAPLVLRRASLKWDNGMEEGTEGEKFTFSAIKKS